MKFFYLNFLRVISSAMTFLLVWLIIIWFKITLTIKKNNLIYSLKSFLNSFMLWFCFYLSERNVTQRTLRNLSLTFRNHNFWYNNATKTYDHLKWWELPLNVKFLLVETIIKFKKFRKWGKIGRIPKKVKKKYIG